MFYICGKYKNGFLMKTVKLITCNDAMKAHILQGALENEGIESILHNENFSTLYKSCVSSIAGVDILVADDIISSGESMIDLARELKKRKANRIFAAATFALFTNGLDIYNQAYEEGIIDRVISTNLTYRTPELQAAEWFIEADMSKYIALIIDHLNHDASLSDLLDPSERISARIAEYKVKHTISDNYENY